MSSAVKWIGLVVLAAVVAWGSLHGNDPLDRAREASADFELDKDKQKKIWDLEHSTFQIETYFGKPFGKALAKGDLAAAQAMFREGFRGRLATSCKGKIRSAGPVSETRCKDPILSDVDARQAVARLRERFAAFDEIRGLTVKVLQIDTVGEAQGHWKTDLRIQVLGGVEGGGLLEHLSYYDAEFRYADRDEVKGGRVLERLELRKEVSRRSDRPLMEEVTAQVGLDALPLPDNWTLPQDRIRTHRYQIAVEDYDRDGYLDIAVGITNGRPMLLRSHEGQRYEDVAGSVGLKSAFDAPKERDINALVSWIDYDNDSWPDLLMGYRLYHNEKGERFTDVTARSGLRFDRVPFGAAVADYDNDGRLDLYIAYQKGFQPRPSGKRPWVGDPYGGAANHLWRNEGGGRFRDVTAEAMAGGGRHQTFAAAAFLFDDDPFPDLYLANDFGENVMLRNRGDGKFEDITARTGTGDFSTSMGAVAGDLDNDGTPELYVANMYSKMGRRIIEHVGEDDYPEGIYPMVRGSLAGNRLYRWDDQGSTHEVSEELGINQVGWAHAPVMADFDADGWLDLYATAGFFSADREKPDG
jgi:hypothetical protein